VLEIDFERFTDAADGDGQLRQIADTAKALAGRSNRDAVNFLMRTVGLCATRTRNDSYYADALHYSLALTRAYAHEPEAAAEHIARSGVLPFDGGDLIFSDANSRALDLAAKQEASLARRVPCVFLSSMPRAASAALTATISALFDCPTVRASIGGFPNYYLMPSWVKRLSRGGCVLHDHFNAGTFNQRVLSDCGIRTVYVLVRDPRAAAASVVQFLQGPGSNVTEDRIQRVFEDWFIPWLCEWEQFAASSQSTEVVWLRSSDVTADTTRLRSVIKGIIESFAKSAPRWKPPDLSRLALADANFVSGKQDGWRRLVSRPTQERMWSKVPSRFREMLELEP
jgi:hypothetical protein